MPEYHQIEMYFHVHEDLDSIRQRLMALCEDIGWLTDAMDAWLQQLVWIVQDDGWVYTGPPSPTLEMSLGNMNVMLRFVAQGWSTTHIPSLPLPCLAWSVLIESTTIQDVVPPDAFYKPGVLDGIWRIMRQMSLYDSSYGVFWTNEAQDSQAWRAILVGNHEACWKFDLAIIYASHFELYHEGHDDFFSTERDQHLFLASKYSAVTPPWA